MHKLMPLVVLVALIGVTVPVFADVVDIGIPVGPTGSWGPTMYFDSHSGSFDQVVAIWYSGQKFEIDPYGGMTASGWTSATDPSGNWASIQGPSADFSPTTVFHLADPANVLTQFYTLQYSNGVLLPNESALVSVGDGFESHVTTNYGTWGWSPINPDRIGVPEPGMIATLMLGILGIGVFWRKRSSNPV